MQIAFGSLIVWFLLFLITLHIPHVWSNSNIGQKLMCVVLIDFAVLAQTLPALELIPSQTSGRSWLGFPTAPVMHLPFQLSFCNQPGNQWEAERRLELQSFNTPKPIVFPAYQLTFLFKLWQTQKDLN